MVTVTIGVCGLCGEAHTSGKNPVVPQHSNLSPIVYRGDSVNSRIIAKQGACGQDTEDEGSVDIYIGV